MSKITGLALAVVIALATTSPAVAAVGNPIPPEYDRLWLEEMDLFLSNVEKAIYLRLENSHSRQAFKRAFWVARDTAPNLTIQPLRQRFLNHLIAARTRGFPMTDPRSRVLLLHGPPVEATVHGRCGAELDNRVVTSRCLTSRAFEMFDYGAASSLGNAPVLFVQRDGQCALFQSRDLPLKIQKFAPQACKNPWYDLQRLFKNAIKTQLSPKEITQAGLTMAARPGWQEDFVNPPPSKGRAPEFEVLRQEQEAGRDGSPVYTLESELSVKAPTDWHSSPVPWRNLFIRTDIFEEGRHVAAFDQYEIAFSQTSQAQSALALPISFKAAEGRFTVVVHVEDDTFDLYETSAFTLNVPIPGLASRQKDKAENRDLNQRASSGAQSLLQQPSIQIADDAGLDIGKKIFVLEAWQGDVERVEYRLDGSTVATQTEPPFAATIDLGPVPGERLLEALAFRGTQVVATDQLTLNPGVHRFSVDLNQPTISNTGIAVSGRVAVPLGAQLKEIELLADDVSVLRSTDAAFRYDGPPAPTNNRVTVFEARATLSDGRTATATKLASRGSTEQVDVNLVEVFAGVVDRAGRPITNLVASDLQILENGVPQTLRTFTHLDELPINVVLLLDTSSTMTEELPDIQQSAQLFLENVIRDDDLAAILAFNHRTFVMAPFTNNKELLAEASASLSAWGGTSLLDSAVLSLYYLHGLEGKKALVLVSDGIEESSSLDFEQLVEYADRVDASVYTIALGLPGGNPTLLQQAQGRMDRIAEQTAGASYQARGPKQIERAFLEIENDLRSQYFLTYESTAGARSKTEDYRKITLEVGRAGAKVRTRPGY